MIEFKNFDFKIKAMDDGMFEGYGSIFGNVDSQRDIVTKGAFTRTIKNNMNRIKILWQHDVKEPIGKPVEMYEDTKGLYMKAKLSIGTDTGKKCYELMKDGVINELSIGYDTIKDEYDKQNNVRYLKELRLWEVSAVTFASNELATVNNVKKLDGLLDEIKEGRMLSKINKGKIEDIIMLLTSLLEENNSETSTCGTPEREKHIEQIKENDIDSEDFHSILTALQQIKNT